VSDRAIGLLVGLEPSRAEGLPKGQVGEPVPGRPWSGAKACKKVRCATSPNSMFGLTGYYGFMIIIRAVLYMISSPLMLEAGGAVF
jgi:hypothetical protein